jgi:hypothetical protein
MFTQITATAQQYDESDLDAFYARQRKEKNEFIHNTELELDKCKVKFERWYKPNDSDAQKFFYCKQAIDQKITLYNQIQALEACTTFQFRCN